MSVLCKIAVLAVCLTLSSYVQGKNTHKEQYYVPYEPKCEPEINFSTVEDSLRSYIFLADVKKAAYTLQSNRTFNLAAGFTYDPEDACAVVKTDDRENDPDVVAFRAAALNVYKYGNPARIAKIMVESFVSDCQSCNVFDGPNELDDIVDGFTAFLSDKKNIHDVLFNDPAEDDVKRRKLLQERSPTPSFICAFCYPSEACSGNCNWCPRS